MIVSDCDPTSNVWIVWTTLEFSEGRKKRSGGVGPKNDPTAPDRPCWERFEIESSYHTEVVLPAFQGCEEVGLRCRICVNDFTTGEHDFEVDNTVAGPSAFWAEERYAA